MLSSLEIFGNNCTSVREISFTTFTTAPFAVKAICKKADFGQKTCNCYLLNDWYLRVFSHLSPFSWINWPMLVDFERSKVANAQSKEPERVATVTLSWKCECRTCIIIIFELK